MIVVLASMQGTAACHGSRDRGNGSRKGPQIDCPSASHDFGEVTQGDGLTHAFRLQNAGSSALSIQSVEKSYSCVALAPTTPFEVAPGRDVLLKVACDARDRQGRLKEALVVHSNDSRTPELSLEVEARVEPLLAFTSMLVELTAAFGAARTVDVGLQGRLASDARLKLERIEGPGPEATVIAGDGRERQTLRLTLAGKRAGTGAGRIFVSTGLARPSELILSYSWVVTGNIDVDPSTPYLNLRVPGPKEIVLKVKSLRPDFRLDAVRVEEGPFEASFDREQALGGYRVRVRAIEERISDEERGVLGKILLLSNDPAEPRKEIGVFGLGRVSRGVARSIDAHGGPVPAPAGSRTDPGQP